MRRPILISPSMSGRFALPFLLAQGDRLAGFVPIAPVGTKNYAAEQYRRVQVRWVVGLLGSPWVLASLVGQLAGGWHGGWPCSGVSEGDLCSPSSWRGLAPAFLQLCSPRGDGWRWAQPREA